MNEITILEILKKEVVDTFKEKNAIKKNLFLIILYCILAYMISHSSHLASNLHNLYRFNIFITSISTSWMIGFTSIFLKYTSKKNNNNNYKHMISYCRYCKLSVLSTITFQTIFIFIKIFKIMNPFILIFGMFIFLNSFMNLYFAVTIMINSFNDNYDKKINLTKKDS